MRLLARFTFIATAGIFTALPPATARGQSGSPVLHVLRHTPSDSAPAGSVVLVVFDHPVAGALDRSVDPHRVFRISPPVDGALGWRDPATIRFVPSAPLTPGSNFRVTIDSGFAAMDGARLAAPYSFSFRVPGPRLLSSWPARADVPGRNLAPDATFSLLVSAPLDESAEAALSRGAKVELTCGTPPNGLTFVIPLRVSARRAVRDDSPWEFKNARAVAGDTAGDGFRRIIELAPTSLLPEGCTGHWYVPSLDTNAPNDVWRFTVSTRPLFDVQKAACPSACTSTRLTLAFTAPVKRSDVERFVTITPATPYRIVNQVSESPVWLLDGEFAPGTTYVVHVAPELEDVHGRRIVHAATVVYAIPDRPAWITYGSGLVTVPRGAESIRVHYSNVDSVTMVVKAVPDANRGSILAGVLADYAVAALRDSVAQVIALHGPFNAERDTTIRIPSVPGHSGQLVAVYLSVRATSRGLAHPDLGPRAAGVRHRPVVFMQSSDLVLHSKIGATRALVFVTRASTGAPVAGARVALHTVAVRNGDLADGISDSTGVAELTAVAGHSLAEIQPLDRGSFVTVAYVAASAGDETAIAPANQNWWTSPLNPGALGARYGGPATPVASVFTDRGIYRPGEKVYLEGIVRDGPLGALRPVTGDSVRVTIVHWGAEPDTLLAVTQRLSEFGTIVDSAAVSPRAGLGVYHVAVSERRSNSWIERGGSNFTVAEYRVPEFVVATTADTGVRYNRDTVRVDVAARYLFGAPMARGKLVWRMSGEEISPSALRIPGIDGYTIGNWNDGWDPRGGDGSHRVPGADGTATLDDRGQHRLALVPHLDSLTLPVRLTVDVAVTDVNNQVVTSSVSRVVNTSSMYIAARDANRGWYWRTGVADTIRLLAVSPNGERVLDVPVDVAVVRHAGEYRERDGWHETTDTVARFSAVTAGDPVPVAFTPAVPGTYEVRFTARDDNGRLASTSLYGFAFGGGIADGRASGLRLAMIAPTTPLEVGDTATLLYTNPFPHAEAWITVEREGVIEQRRAAVSKGEQQVSLVVTDRHVPNVYVSVMLVARRSAFDADSLLEVIRVGYAELHVRTTTKQLAVALLPASRLVGPSDSTTIGVHLTDRGRGVRGEATVWAIDEGVRSLTQFQLPDPISDLYKDRGLGSAFQSSVWTALRRPMWPIDNLRFRSPATLGSTVQLDRVVLTSSVESVEAPGEVPVPTRSVFRSTAFFVGRVVTDDSGRAVVRAKLPDNLTTFRLMAVAVTAGDRYGHASDSLLATRAVVVRPSLPRFLRTGDSLVAGAALNVRSGVRQQATVSSTVTGLTMYGARAKSVELGPSAAIARWHYVVPRGDTAGSSVLLHFSASSKDGADAVDASLPIRASYVPRAHTIAGVARGTERVTFTVPADIDPARSRLSLELAGSPLGVLRWAYRYLRVYPYYCTEQISSTGRAMIAVYRARQILGADSAGDELLGPTPSATLQRLADELARRQRADGAIRYWTTNDWSTPWLSANAGLFLLEARAAGVIVERRVTDGLARYLRSILSDHSFLADTLDGTRADRAVRLQRWLGERLAAAQYLSRAGSPLPAEEARLVVMSNRMTWEDRVWLADLIGRYDVPAGRQILADAWRAVSVGGNRVDFPDSTIGRGDFSSHVRPPARLLEATLALDPQHPLLGALMQAMLQLGRAERGWAWNTQDYSSAIVAAASLSRQQGAVASGGVSVSSDESGRVLLSRTPAAASSRDSSVSLDGLVRRGAGGLVEVPLAVVGGAAGSPLYYALTVTEIPRKPSTTPDDRGIFVERWYERYSDGVPVTSVDEGDLVRVRLRVTVPGDREFVALDDALPAGLEAVDLSLATSATLGPFAGRRDADRGEPGWRSGAWSYGSWDQGWWSPWEHRELRDDRVVYFARMLWKGTYAVSYVARATTAGVFVRPPATAEEMYNPALGGRTEGGVLRVRERGSGGSPK